MTLTEAQQNLVLLLNKHGVRYLVIGGYAMRAIGVARPTRDLDLWIANSKQNAKRVARAFHSIHAPLPKGGDWVSAFHQELALYAYPDTGPTKEADLLTGIRGMEFDACYHRSLLTQIDGLEARALNIHDLIASKEIAAMSGNDEAAHIRDNADIRSLKALL